MAKVYSTGADTVRRRPYARCQALCAEELSGKERFSFDLYYLAGSRLALRPCERPADKVIHFVMRYMPNEIANR
ncbi:hypothetical protein SAMN05192583_3142 [Sphingomonas gellani]|uniref:Uncharacterized protein n=1 Tax=Sphingomonas gellani TaxID=1166340 RepID=A0A1H8HXM9_9SPHN|nr:hypothetical protein SAMN05192583_3142 [Sphingomonas gellani]